MSVGPDELAGAVYTHLLFRCALIQPLWKLVGNKRQLRLFALLGQAIGVLISFSLLGGWGRGWNSSCGYTKVSRDEMLP